MKAESKEVKDVVKHLQIKKYGDSWYIPLTKFFKPLGMEVGKIVDVYTKEGRIIIEKEKSS